MLPAKKVEKSWEKNVEKSDKFFIEYVSNMSYGKFYKLKNVIKVQKIKINGKKNLQKVKNNV